MARLSQEATIEALTTLGVDFDPTLSYAELSELLKETKAQNEPQDEGNTGDEQVTEEVEETPENEADEPQEDKKEVVTGTVGDKRIKYNLLHSGETFNAGDMISSAHPYFAEIVALGHTE